MKNCHKLHSSGDSEEYRLLDSGNGRKLERWGSWTLSRPCAAALWKPKLPPAIWLKADADFDRESGNRWTNQKPLPSEWQVRLAGLKFKVSPTGFGHVGVFPEHQWVWEWMGERAKKRGQPIRFLNLFAYTGGATMAMARAGARVCHLDASKGMVQRARENAALNGLADAPIRWIVEDVRKFLAREIKRGTYYDAILLDPPSFGRGHSGEVFKIEEHLVELLAMCERLLSNTPAFAVITCHTPALTPWVLSHLLSGAMQARGGSGERGELLLAAPDCERPLPSGSYAAIDFEKKETHAPIH